MGLTTNFDKSMNTFPIWWLNNKKTHLLFIKYDFNTDDENEIRSTYKIASDKINDFLRHKKISSVLPTKTFVGPRTKINDISHAKALTDLFINAFDSLISEICKD